MSNTKKNYRNSRVFANPYNTKHIVTIHRSNANIMAQVSDPVNKKVLFTTTSSSLQKLTKSDKSIQVGERIADYLNKQKITHIVFNRNGFIYKGKRVSLVAQAIRDNGVTF